MYIYICIYTHPTCLIRRQQWHNKSWRLQSRLPGRVRQTDRPSNAFIIILNHIFFFPLPLHPGPSFRLVPSTVASALRARLPHRPLNSTRFPLSFSLPPSVLRQALSISPRGRATNISKSPPPPPLVILCAASADS